MKRLIMLLLAVSCAAAVAQPEPPGLQINCPPTITLPRNTFATLGSSLVLTQNVQTVIDVRAVALSGDFRLNGGVFPGGQNAAIMVRPLQPGNSLYLGGTQAGAYATVIVPGHYSAFYNWAVGDLIPRNQNARLICPR